MVDESLDCKGMMCPMPIVHITKKIKTMNPGQVLEVVADDVGSLEDVPAWADRTGNELMEKREDGGEFHFIIRKS